MMSIRALVVFGIALAAASGATVSSAESVSPQKAVKQAEAKLKRLAKEGEDRPSVHAARFELVEALRALDSCEVHERMDRELASVTAWLERSAIPVRLIPQHVYNEVGRLAQARAQCTQDEAQQNAYHEAALSAFTRARKRPSRTTTH